MGLAEAVLESLDDQFGIPPDLVSGEQLRSILKRLEPVTEITHGAYFLGRFLSYVAKRAPEQLLDYLLKRVGRAAQRQNKTRDYTPIPFGLEGLFSGVEDAGVHDALLRKVALELSRSSGTRRYWLTQLFALVAGGFGPPALRLITELSEEREEATYRLIATVLSAAPRGFAFANEELCATLLERSEDISFEAHRAIHAALLTSTQSGSYSGALGQPSAAHESIRDQANEAARRLDRRPAGATFFRDVAKYAQETIDRMLEHAQEYLIE